MNQKNYTIQATVIDIIRTKKNLTATKLDRLNLSDTQKDHEYWRLNTIMSDGKLSEFINRLNDENMTSDKKQTLLDRHCTPVQSLIDQLSESIIPETIKWTKFGPNSWTIRLDDVEIHLIQTEQDDYIITQTLFIDDGSYKQYITRLKTDAPLNDVKRQALDIVTDRMQTMVDDMLTKMAILQNIKNMPNPYPGTIFSTACIPDRNYAKRIQSQADQNGIYVNAYAEAQEYAAAKLNELKNLLDKDLASFTLLIIKNATFRQYGRTEWSTKTRTISNQRLSDVLELAISSDGCECELHANKSRHEITSTYTDNQRIRCNTQYRLVKDNDPSVGDTLDIMLSTTEYTDSEISEYLDNHTESLYNRFEKCLKGTWWWPN